MMKRKSFQVGTNRKLSVPAAVLAVFSASGAFFSAKDAPAWLTVSR